MNIIERAKQFAQSLYEKMNRSAWEWKKCPYCGGTNTIKNGGYMRHPWYLDGRREERVQRHLCYDCNCRTYSEESALLVRGSWYAREVHRYAVDMWVHLGTSQRRAAEWLRSEMGRQERYRWWHILKGEAPAGKRCYLNASTVNRWLDKAGVEAEKTVEKQLEGAKQSTAVGVDGLWARLCGKTKRVVLAAVDTVSGLIWPPVVVEEEDQQAWGQMFGQAQKAGLSLSRLRGVTSDGAKGLLKYMREKLIWVRQQRCLWHIRHNLHDKVKKAAAEAATGLAEEVASQVRQEATRTLNGLIDNVLRAKTYAQAEAALAMLQGHALGAAIAQFLNEQFDALLVYTLDYYHDLATVTPEWIWRDFRLRLSHGRNHGSDQRLRRAALVWAIYHNFTPHQYRSERKRHYRHPGLCPLEVAGLPPPPHISYLDALGV